MSDLFVQAADNNGAGTAVTLNGVTAGNTLIAFVMNGGGVQPTGIADGQGSYTQGALLAANANNCLGAVWKLDNANAGTHTVSGISADLIVLVEVGAGGAYVGSNAGSQALGAGADNMQSGNITVSVPSTIIALGVYTSTSSPSDIPAVGTSPIAFTSRASNNNGAIGSWRLESAAISSTGQATFGSPVGGAQETFAAVVANAGGGGGGAAAETLTLLGVG